ncbi:hypothetical protein Bbelb_019030 [Branchiostoma belcheri]|nr:hypothetical protein Bbelb_019030 [Branchiostoma belcheri]
MIRWLPVPDRKDGLWVGKPGEQGRPVRFGVLLPIAATSALLLALWSLKKSEKVTADNRLASFVTKGILPYSLRGLLGEEQRRALTKLREVIGALTYPVVCQDKIPGIQSAVDESLVLVERYFPSHVMTHVPAYLERYGPARGYWMFIFEQLMHLISTRVTDNRYPEASVMIHIQTSSQTSQMTQPPSNSATRRGSRYQATREAERNWTRDVLVPIIEAAYSFYGYNIAPYVESTSAGNPTDRTVSPPQEPSQPGPGADQKLSQPTPGAQPARPRSRSEAESAQPARPRSRLVARPAAQPSGQPAPPAARPRSSKVTHAHPTTSSPRRKGIPNFDFSLFSDEVLAYGWVPATKYVARRLTVSGSRTDSSPSPLPKRRQSGPERKRRQRRRKQERRQH